MSKTQSVIFSKHEFNITTARKWLKDNNFKYSGKLRKTSNYYSFRQLNPAQFKKFRIKKIDEGILLILGFT